MLELFKATNNFVWGPPLLLLLVGTGVYFTIRLGLFQLSKLPTAFRLIFSSDQSGQGDVSSFAALCTALAATVGTGNIVGVATAITTGGPGALFWMWVAAFFGMATKYAEGFLAIKYRTRDADGHAAGGPMHRRAPCRRNARARAASPSRRRTAGWPAPRPWRPSGSAGWRWFRRG